MSGWKPVSQSAGPNPTSPGGKVKSQPHKVNQWGNQQQKAEKAPTTDGNQTPTEDGPTERRKIIGQSQQQEEDTKGDESEEKAALISATELSALVLLQLLIKLAETHLDEYIGPGRPRQVIKRLRLNGSNISAWSFSRLNDDSADS